MEPRIIEHIQFAHPGVPQDHFEWREIQPKQNGVKQMYYCETCFQRFQKAEMLVNHLNKQHSITANPKDLHPKNVDEIPQRIMTNHRKENVNRRTKMCIDCGQGPVKPSQGNICNAPEKHAICKECLVKRIPEATMYRSGSLKCVGKFCQSVITLGKMERILDRADYMLLQNKLENLVKDNLKPKLTENIRGEVEREFYNPHLEVDCCICGDEVLKDRGVKCSRNHGTCAECLGQNILLSDDIHMDTDGSIKCCGYQCPDRIPIGKLEVVLEKNPYNKLIKIFQQLTEQIVIPDLEKRLNSELEKKHKLNSDLVQHHKKMIIENALTLKCPNQNCKQAFIDFNGCFALTCSRCSTAFCAYCLANCGHDAHQHVVSCRMSDGNRSVFGTLEQFNKGQIARRTVMVQNYLRMIDDAELVKEACRQEFLDLGIQI